MLPGKKMYPQKAKFLRSNLHIWEEKNRDKESLDLRGPKIHHRLDLVLHNRDFAITQRLKKTKLICPGTKTTHKKAQERT